MDCIEIKGSIFNLNLIKRVSLYKDQFGEDVLRLDDWTYTGKEAKLYYAQIKALAFKNQIKTKANSKVREI